LLFEDTLESNSINGQTKNAPIVGSQMMSSYGPYDGSTTTFVGRKNRDD